LSRALSFLFPRNYNEDNTHDNERLSAFKTLRQPAYIRLLSFPKKSWILLPALAFPLKILYYILYIQASKYREGPSAHENWGFTRLSITNKIIDRLNIYFSRSLGVTIGYAFGQSIVLYVILNFVILVFHFHNVSPRAGVSNSRPGQNMGAHFCKNIGK
jgi:hypothetical protein